MPANLPCICLRIPSLVAGLVALTGPLSEQEGVEHLNPELKAF